MSEPENFLSRWSRRKLDAEQQQDDSHSSEQSPSARPESGDPESDKETAESAALDSRSPGNERSPDSDDAKEPEFDITTLPSIESIGAETDIRVFLQKGVPADLTRAALRRAWTADPNIRDFIEMAENQWDFATGSDIPGFGPLEASDDVRKMVAEIFGEGLKPKAEAEATTIPGEAETPAEPASSETATGSAEPPGQQDIADAAQDQPKQETAPAEPAEVIVQRNEVDVAMRQTASDSDDRVLPTRRSHGGALPD